MSIVLNIEKINIERKKLKDVQQNLKKKRKYIANKKNYEIHKTIKKNL